MAASYLLAILYLLNSVDAFYAENGSECKTSAFPCYRDCCEKETMFCNAKKEKCSFCSDREFLCRNETMPFECQLYCYKLQENKGADCILREIVILFCVVSAVAGGLVVGVPCGIAFMLRKKSGSITPESGTVSMSSLPANNDKLTSNNLGEQEKPLLPNTTTEEDTHRDPNTVADAQALNLTLPDGKEKATPIPEPPAHAGSGFETPVCGGPSSRQTSVQPSDVGDHPTPTSGRGYAEDVFASDVQSTTGRGGEPRAFGAAPSSGSMRLNFSELNPTTDDPKGQIALSTVDPLQAYK